MLQYASHGQTRRAQRNSGEGRIERDWKIDIPAQCRFALCRALVLGDGVDIGAGNDSLKEYLEFFPLVRSLKAWDLADGDAQFLAGVADERFDFVYSSHCLEHMVDPRVALENWVRVCRPGGHLVLMFPDEDLYEQGVFPSSFNPDHKWTFTLHKAKSWSPKSVNVLDMLIALSDRVEILKVEQLNATFRYGARRMDQTQTPLGESAIELVLKKRG